MEQAIKLTMEKVTKLRIVNYFGTMEKIGSRLAGMNIYLFFSLLFIYQILLVFQGIDMLDEGFHASSYQQIFNDPQSVQYTFLYWLADVAGGLVVKIFPGSGLLGIRIAGALVSASTIVVTYNILKKHISPGILKMSLVLLALFINNDPKNLYYNNLSALLYVISAYFLYTGLTKNKGLLILAGGFFIGLNIFTRLPNLLAPGIGLAVFYYGICIKQPIKKQFSNFLLFGAGCALAIGLILLLMQMLGQLQLYIDSIRQLLSISSGATSDDGLNGSYGPFNIIIQTAKQYGRATSLIVGILAVVAVCSYALNYTKNFPVLGRIAVKAAMFVFVGYVSYSMIIDGILDYQLIELFTGMSMAAAFIILIRGKDNAIKLIVAMGTFFMFAHPLGSAVGIYTVIPYSMWLLFPFAIMFMGEMRQFSLVINVAREKDSIKILTGEKSTRLIKHIGLFIIILTCLVHIVRFPYFYDRHSRWEMTYPIGNKFTKGIYTSKERAASINELLSESAKYIKPNDYVLAYDLIPMYHFWTETRPYVRNPCPWFYSSGVFQNELDLAQSKISTLPVVVMQTILTIGDGSKWPEEQLKADYMKWDRNEGRNAVMDKFLTDHQYKIVWQNDVFRIMIPGTGSTAGTFPAAH